MLIESVDNKKIKYIKKLRDNKFIKKEKKFIVEGEHLVTEALSMGFLLSVVKLEGYDKSYNAPEIIVKENVMKSISLMNSIPKVIGICKVIEESSILGNRIIILDDVQDPGNIGTIIRSAKAFNFTSVILSLSSVSKYNYKVIRATGGMLFKTNIITRNLLDFIPLLKEKGYKIYSTNVNNGVDVKNIDKNDKIAVIVGNEGCGVSDSISKLADENLYINMDSNCESLNVSVAASIIMYELGGLR